MEPFGLTVESKLIIGGSLLLVSILASKLSAKLGIPTLVLFLLIGIATRKWMETEDLTKDTYAIAKFLGVTTLAFILFSGGLETDIKHISPILVHGLLLSTIGVLITAVIVGFLLSSTGQLSLKQGITVGAIVASTDAAAVFSILRTRKISLKAKIGPLLELESGSNDVMVYFLMGFLLQNMLTNGSEMGILNAIPSFFLQMGLGIIGGIITCYVMLWILNKSNLPQESLYPPLTLALISLTYGVVESLHGSGYLAVYTAGIFLGNRDFIHRKSITKFYKGFGWLLEIGMFIALGFLVKPEKLAKMALPGALLSVSLMLFIRPISVFLSLFFAPFNAKQKAFISWVGLRGAVPIVFATYLYNQNKDVFDTPLADEAFHLIFFVVLTSIIIQGTTLHRLAKWLGLEAKNQVPKYKKHILELNDNVKKMVIQLEVLPGSPADQTALVDIGLPKETLIVLICRDQTYFPARGSTILQAHDRLFVMVDDKKEIQQVKTCLGIA